MGSQMQPRDAPEGNVVILVCKGDDPMAVVFGHREQVTKDIRHLGHRKGQSQVAGLILTPHPHHYPKAPILTRLPNREVKP